eukprot:TRINITY_DN45929_c0_g1_i1.p1 TRINITY_DN45929_c0_g1~~TRINITY_DN45929_c0_g1_i1.p1  ORF type:complete len:691 (+),score=160.59 TRINITY_DN45929_c0_g1_i1:65-2074(+)
MAEHSPRGAREPLPVSGRSPRRSAVQRELPQRLCGARYEWYDRPRAAPAELVFDDCCGAAELLGCTLRGVAGCCQPLGPLELLLCIGRGSAAQKYRVVFSDAGLRSFAAGGTAHGAATPRSAERLRRGPGAAQARAAQAALRKVAAAAEGRSRAAAAAGAAARSAAPPAPAAAAALAAAVRHSLARRGLVCRCCGLLFAPPAEYARHRPGCEAALRTALLRQFLPLRRHLPSPGEGELPRTPRGLAEFNRAALVEYSRSYVACDGCGKLYAPFAPGGSMPLAEHMRHCTPLALALGAAGHPPLAEAGAPAAAAAAAAPPSAPQRRPLAFPAPYADLAAAPRWRAPLDRESAAALCGALQRAERCSPRRPPAAPARRAVLEHQCGGRLLRGEVVPRGDPAAVEATARARFRHAIAPDARLVFTHRASGSEVAAGELLGGETYIVRAEGGAPAAPCAAQQGDGADPRPSPAPAGPRRRAISLRHLVLPAGKGPAAALAPGVLLRAEVRARDDEDPAAVESKIRSRFAEAVPPGARLRFIAADGAEVGIGDLRGGCAYDLLAEIVPELAASPSPPRRPGRRGSAPRLSSVRGGSAPRLSSGASAQQDGATPPHRLPPVAGWRDSPDPELPPPGLPPALPRGPAPAAYVARERSGSVADSAQYSTPGGSPGRM